MAVGYRGNRVAQNNKSEGAGERGFTSKSLFQTLPS